MDWILPSFAIVLLALAGGFGWYERSHPSSRTLALVATLGAFAALGRVAFAAFPSVKPTTAVVLLSGYVLGPAAGFVVGAVGALGSNVFLGQGPWTPWQMAGWGLVGLFGAALRPVTGGNAGRATLAGAAAVAGLLYGALLDFSSWVTFTGDHTLAQYLVIAGGSLWFNVAHAVASAVFCLALGPVLVRALHRYQERFEVTWEPVSRPAGDAASG